MKNNFIYIKLLLAVIFCLSITTFGQETTGSLEGTVKDANGAVVPNVAVTITTSKQTAAGTTTTGTGAGFRRTLTTNDEGFFRVLQVPPGTYDVVTTATGGFGEARYEKVSVSIGQSTQLAIIVNPGSNVNTVDVTAADAPPVDTTNNAIQTSISAQKIELIPKGNDYTSILKTVPGTRPESRTGGFSIDGASGGENVFVIDGQEVTNFRTGTLNANNAIPTQLVQEVQVKSSGFGAEFGGATGGVVSVVTKGGGTAFHGEIGTQFDTPNLNGNPRPILQRFSSGTGAAFVQETTYLNPPKAGGVDSFPTFSLGGPVLKNKVYFFGSYSPQYYLIETQTQFYSDTLAASRTLLDVQPFRLKRKQEYAFARLDASPFNNLQLTGTYLWNPIIDQGSVPYSLTSTASNTIGGVIPSLATVPGTINIGPLSTSDYGGSIGVLNASQIAARQGGRQNSNNVTAQAIYTATSNLVFTGRFSRGFLNERLGSYFVPPGLRVICTNGNTAANPNQFPGGCTQGFSGPDNADVFKDASIRTNFEGDATYIFNLGGRHELKGGYQRFRITNDVETGFIDKGRITFFYGVNITDAGAPVAPTAGAIGSAILRRQGTRGFAQNLNQGLYIQDKYQPFRRLSLNLGVRIEKEDLPSFNGFAPPINFGWGDKVAPRLGFAYDIFGDGKTKVFGSYGQFFDRLKFNLPRGSFGGDFFLEDFFEIFPGESFTQFNNQTVLNGRSRFQRNLRIASNDPNGTITNGGRVDPNLEPFQQSEFTVGVERQLSRDYVFRSRYTYKNVDQAVEDAGVRNAQDSEAYIIGNPGQGLHLQVLQQLGYTKSAKPQRRYDGLEFVVEKRLSNNWFFNANYTYSRLYGNYSGLTSSDEINAPTGRLAPSTTRAFDLPFVGFTALGQPDNGRLETDRPHVFNVYGAYIFGWMGSKTNSTELSGFQTVASGTPQSSRLFIVSTITPAIYLKRGDLGRTPTFTQTDFNITHRYKFGRDNRFTVAADFNILNLFDQDTVTGVYTIRNLSSSIITATNLAGATRPNDAVFVNAYTSGSLLAAINTYLDGNATTLNRKDARYGQPSTFQAPRQIRFGFRFLF